MKLQSIKTWSKRAIKKEILELSVECSKLEDKYGSLLMDISGALVEVHKAYVDVDSNYKEIREEMFRIGRLAMENVEFLRSGIGERLFVLGDKLLEICDRLEEREIQKS